MKRFFFTTYFILVLGVISVLFGVIPIIDILMEPTEIQFNTMRFKGFFSLIENRLIDIDADQRETVFETIKSHFGHDLWMISVDSPELGLDAQKTQQLMNGKILSVDSESSLFDDQDVVVRRLGETRSAVVIVQDPAAENEDLITTLFFTLSMFILFLPALVWTWMLHRDLKKVRMAVIRFEQGDHNTRVSLFRGSSLSWIASGFNRMADKTQRLLKSHREMSNNVSHEIRTPLARIKFSIEMMDRDGAGHRRRNYLDEIRQDADEIDALVDEMLTYARFDGEADLNRDITEHDILPWIDHLVTTEKRGYQDKEIILEINENVTRMMARFDRRYLQWAVRNLIRNGAGHAVSCVKVTAVKTSHGINIHVDDDGKGIDASDYDKIFEPFVRLNADRSPESGGYGIGLALARQITQWHRGQLRVSRSPMGGARFTIELPLLPV